MAISIKTVERLQSYFKGVVKRAEHHAQGVKEVIYPTLCLIIAYFDPNSDIEVSKDDGSQANTMWVHINGTRYVFAYEHKKSVIEIRKGSREQPALYSIDNTKTIKDLINIFEVL